MSTNQPLEQLRKIQRTIYNKLEVLDGLNVEFKNKQQRQFLKTFMHIMDKMSNQLVVAQQKYNNIDKEIENDEKCVQLNKQLNFFRDQCINLKKELTQAELQLEEQRRNNQKFEKQKQMLNKTLMKKSKQALRYRSRMMSLRKDETQVNNSVGHNTLGIFTPEKQHLKMKGSEKLKMKGSEKLKITTDMNKTWNTFNHKNNKLSSSSPGKQLPTRQYLISTSYGADRKRKLTGKMFS